jgi:spore coat protein CotH
MKNFLGLVVFAFITASCFAQNFYDANSVQEIRIYFAQSNWDQMLDTAEAGTDSYIMADSVKINGTTLRQVGIKYKGNSSYNPTQIKNPFHIYFY